MAKHRGEGRLEGDYEVGHSRPPKRTQFKPGHSGNPKGRPKGRKNIHTILEETLYRPVTITEKGRKRTVSAIEAMLLGVTQSALGGDLRAFEKITKHLSMVQAVSAEREAQEEGAAADPEHDAEVLAEFAQMIRDTDSRKPKGRKR
jgi:hypothetical protein